MTEEEKAQRLATWLAGPAGGDPPEELDEDVLAAVYILKPSHAPAPRVSIADVVDSVTEGPFASGSETTGEVIQFPARPVESAPVGSGTGTAGAGEAGRPRRRSTMWAWSLAGATMAAAAALLLVVPIAGRMSRPDVTAGETAQMVAPAAPAAPAAGIAEDESPAQPTAGFDVPTIPEAAPERQDATSLTDENKQERRADEPRPQAAGDDIRARSTTADAPTAGVSTASGSAGAPSGPGASGGAGAPSAAISAPRADKAASLDTMHYEDGKALAEMPAEMAAPAPDAAPARVAASPPPAPPRSAPAPVQSPPATASKSAAPGSSSPPPGPRESKPAAKPSPSAASGQAAPAQPTEELAREKEETAGRKAKKDAQNGAKSRDELASVEADAGIADAEIPYPGVADADDAPVANATPMEPRKNGVGKGAADVDPHPRDYSADGFLSRPDVAAVYAAAAAASSTDAAVAAYASLLTNADANVAQDAAWRAATAQFRAGRFDAALTTISLGTRRSTANTAVHANLLALRGDVYAAQGKLAEANRAWAEASALNAARGAAR